MSAIWGIIDLNQNTINPSITNFFDEMYKDCVIDRMEHLLNNNVYLGCGIQYFTSFSHYEKLPIQKGDVFFTADVLLDNRKDLCRLLEIDETSSLSDGEIMLQTIEKFGDSAPDMFLGAYTYLYYNRGTNTLQLVVDCVQERTVYYSIQDNIFYFSTLMDPLAKLLHSKINQDWCADFLSMDNLLIFCDAESTIYENIYNLPAATVLTCTQNKVTKNQYWNPIPLIHSNAHLSDSEVQKRLLDIFTDAVISKIPDHENISILLSGGLDSNSVAAIAAPYLKKQNRMLYSYTSVPLKDYKSEFPKKLLVDESDLVKKTTSIYTNIIPTFVSLEDQNSWDLHFDELKITEFPYKSTMNLLWIKESMDLAYKNNSRIMLCGEYGNTTISYFDTGLYLADLFTHFQWIKLIKELNLYHENYNFSRKSMLKYAVSHNLPHNKYRKLKKPNYGNSYIKESFIQQTHVGERKLQLEQQFNKAAHSYKISREFVIQDISLRQIGETNTKHSLATGVIERDPTKDKKVIEFCISLPLAQFNKDGIERRLVRACFKEILPKHILEDKKRGRQSADELFRIQKNWPDIRQKWITSLEKYKDNPYVNTHDLITLLHNSTTMPDFNHFDINRIILTIMLLEKVYS